MYHYLLELVLWVLLAVFIGCVIGYFARRLFGSEQREVLLEQANIITPASPLEIVKPIDDPIMTPKEVEAGAAALAATAAGAAAVSSTVSADETALKSAAVSVVPAVTQKSEGVVAVEPPLTLKSDVKPVVKSTVKAETKTATAKTAKSKTPAAAQAPKLSKPRGINAPRKGGADDLQRISGIGPKNEQILNDLGIYHFDQMAAWTPEQVAWVDDHLRFNGRILREKWIKQANLLANGKEAEFRRLFGTGGQKTVSGRSAPGSKTSKR